MGPGLTDQVFVDEKADAQHAPAKQQRHHRAGFQPVEAVALIEAGIDHRDAGTEQQHAAPVGILKQGAVDRLARRSEIDHQSHQRRHHDALPVQPLPTEMFDIEADRRGRGVECEPDPDRIQRDRRQPPFDRQVAEDDHQGGGNEGAEQEAVHDAERDQRRVIVHERHHQRDQGIEQAGNAEHAAQPEHGGEPRHRRRDADLRADRRGGKPGALVEAQRKRPAQVRQSDRGQPAVEIAQEGGEQHRDHREHRPRRDATARQRSGVVMVIFAHPRPAGRCECGFRRTCRAAGAPAASVPDQARS